MELTTTIRTELEQFIKNNNLTITQFAELSDMNCGTISNIIRGQRPIAMLQLDKITVGMGLPPGSFYEKYAKECFVYDTPNWRRLRPFIHKCAELNLLLPLEIAINGVMDNLTYIPILFDTAEQLFNEGKNDAAAILYSCVAESEKYQHSERLALCQYRLFTINIGDDHNKNLRVAVQFEPYVERLDEIDQLDALRDLSKLYTSLQRWYNADILAEKLETKAKIQYSLRHAQGNKKTQYKEPRKPLFGYILYSQLLQAEINNHKGNYEKALQYTYLYADMSWVIENDPEAEQNKKQFKIWATANTYAFQIMTGKIDMIDDYIKFVSNHKQEVFPALFTIVKAANKFNVNIDYILSSYETLISEYIHGNQKNGSYTSIFFTDRFSHFLVDLATYYLSKNLFANGLNYLLNSLALSIRICSESCMIRNISLFEQYRREASENTIIQYQKLISEVQYLNEQKIGLITSSF